MRLFRNNKEPVTNKFRWLQRDIHCHLLPGIDDGSPDVETSLRMIRQLEAAGIRDFVCTPHVFGDMFRNTPETINRALKTLRQAVKEQGLWVNLSAGAEYMLDDYFMELLRSGDPLLTVRNNTLLTEFPYTIAPGNVEEMVFDIMNAGYQPILAHPERYGYYHKNLKAYQRLKELGFMFQMNLLSLTGYYGGRVRSTAKLLVKSGMVDFVGSDLHHEYHLRELISERSQEIFEKYLGSKTYNDFQFL